MQSVKVQVDYKNGKTGVYECTQRPYFTYQNNTAMMHTVDGTTIVVNMLEVVSLSYPIEKKN